jgi:magnesium-transporting ATPase (P-type)
LLTGGFTEVMLIGLAIAFRLPLPVLASQILWKNLIESTPPAMALTFEPKEKGIMSRKPEPADLPLLTREMKVFIFVIGLLTNFLLFGIFWWMWQSERYGPDKIDLIRTVMFAGLAIDSFFFIFSFRNLRLNLWQYNPFSNLYLNIVVLISFLLLMAAVYLPPLQVVLRTVPFGLFEWSILFIYALINIILIEATKRYYRRR